MNKTIYPLLIAQFLSAFADNAILFTVIAMVMHASSLQDWYVPALQSVFLVAFVVLAPWVGGLSDNYPKAKILLCANLIKALGAVLILLKVEPLIAYCIVGIGAAAYSPAKYGILPELAGHNQLVKANSWIEGSTILAILLGMLVGAKLADQSVNMALVFAIGLYVTSAFTTLLLPARIVKDEFARSRLVEFASEIKQFLLIKRSRFAILGASLFWAAAATLRVILVAWAPLVLMLKNATEIANLTLFLAIGIIVGSAIVPRLIPLEHIRRIRFAGYLMAIFISFLSCTQALQPARAVLFCIGIAGGIFIVPLNAALQEIGQQSIGSGSAVALQNFFQNFAQLLAVGSYTLAAAGHIGPVAAMLSLGIIVFLSTFFIALRLSTKSRNNQTSVY